MKQLNSDEGAGLLLSINDNIRRHLDEIDAEIGVDDSHALDISIEILNSAQETHASSPDEVLNDIFVLKRYVAFFRSYGKLWREISLGNHSKSWQILQDANDALRLIRKWSELTLSPLVDQLLALESLYPYKIFTSSGFVVELFECSICGKDIDSLECSHRKGELYRGEIAYGIAKNILDIDHIAFVENPVDKRCVVTIPNNASGFSGIKYLSEALNQRSFAVSNFGGVAWEKKLAPNAQHVRLGRNSPCHCQSGKKFKHCCIGNEFREIDHAEILLTHSVFSDSGLR